MVLKSSSLRCGGVLEYGEKKPLRCGLVALVVPVDVVLSFETDAFSARGGQLCFNVHMLEMMKSIPV